MIRVDAEFGLLSRVRIVKLLTQHLVRTKVWAPIAIRLVVIWLPVPNVHSRQVRNGLSVFLPHLDQFDGVNLDSRFTPNLHSRNKRNVCT